jgi:hypothetical protein
MNISPIFRPLARLGSGPDALGRPGASLVPRRRPRGACALDVAAAGRLDALRVLQRPGSKPASYGAIRRHGVHQERAMKNGGYFQDLPSYICHMAIFNGNTE